VRHQKRQVSTLSRALVKNEHRSRRRDQTAQRHVNVDYISEAPLDSSSENRPTPAAWRSVHGRRLAPSKPGPSPILATHTIHRPSPRRTRYVVLYIEMGHTGSPSRSSLKQQRARLDAGGTVSPPPGARCWSGHRRVRTRGLTTGSAISPPPGAHRVGTHRPFAHGQQQRCEEGRGSCRPCAEPRVSCAR